MKSNILKLIVINTLVLIGLLQSCSNKDEELVCNDLGIVIVAKVNGKELTKFYTIRRLNSELIQFSKNEFPTNQNIVNYPVISNYKISNFKNKTEEFDFIGEINGNIVLKERYKIKSDKCGNRSKVSGKDEINL